MTKFFTNDKAFKAVVLVTVLASIVFLACRFVLEGSFPMYNLPQLLFALCTLFLYFSYRKHSKNVMKGMMGAFLMAQLLCAISLCSGMEAITDRICAPIYAALTLLLFVNHFIINSDHHSQPGHVRFNQVLCVLIAVLTVVWSIWWLVKDFSLVNVISELASALTHAGSAAAVVCVESRLDAYRIEREANGYKAE